MSFTDTLTLDDASGDDTVYVKLSQDSTGTRRLNSASTSAEPSALVIKHTSSGAGVNAVDRHLVQFSQTKLDANDIPRSAIVNFTMAVPRATVITSAMVIDLVSNLIDLISDGTFGPTGIGGTVALTQLLRGEA